MNDQESHDTLVRIDERTQNMYDLLKTHIVQDEKVHEDLQKKVHRNSKIINMFLGAVGLSGASIGSWFGFK